MASKDVTKPDELPDSSSSNNATPRLLEEMAAQLRSLASAAVAYPPSNNDDNNDGTDDSDRERNLVRTKNELQELQRISSDITASLQLLMRAKREEIIHRIHRSSSPLLSRMERDLMSTMVKYLDEEALWALEQSTPLIPQFRDQWERLDQRHPQSGRTIYGRTARERGIRFARASKFARQMEAAGKLRYHQGRPRRQRQQQQPHQQEEGAHDWPTEMYNPTDFFADFSRWYQHQGGAPHHQPPVEFFIRLSLETCDIEQRERELGECRSMYHALLANSEDIVSAEADFAAYMANQQTEQPTTANHNQRAPPILWEGFVSNFSMEANHTEDDAITSVEMEDGIFLLFNWKASFLGDLGATIDDYLSPYSGWWETSHHIKGWLLNKLAVSVVACYAPRSTTSSSTTTSHQHDAMMKLVATTRGFGGITPSSGYAMFPSQSYVPSERETDGEDCVNLGLRVGEENDDDIGFQIELLVEWGNYEEV